MSLKKPEMKYRAIPFWSLNGRLCAPEMKRQAAILKRMGFGGAVLHSRCALQTEYMSQPWMEVLEETAVRFRELQMQAYLYDEDRWPSGSCGGMVTVEKDFRQKYLSMYIGPAAPAEQEVLACFACRLVGTPDSHQTYLGKRLAQYRRCSPTDPVPEGFVKLFVCVEYALPSEFYNGNTYPDTLNRRATDRFLELTHEVYKKSFGQRFGKEFTGIFTDEPHRGGVFNGFNLPNKNGSAMLPWTYDLFSYYAELFGEDLESRLPELFFGPEDGSFNVTVYRYLEVLQQMFLKNFLEPVSRWCRENNLALTGHVWEENTLFGQISWQGSVMRSYEYMDHPGIDNIRDDNYFFAAPLQAVSVAKQTGKTQILSEMYACTGWKTTFDYFKRSGDWQAILGINLRCPHLSWYTMGGEAKRDCPSSIFHQAGWHLKYRYVEDYFARLNMTFGQAGWRTDTLVLSPIESAWGLVRAGQYASQEAFRQLESGWSALLEKLLFAGVDFDIGEEDILARLGRVEETPSGSVFRVGQMCYQSVIIPRSLHLRASTLRLLEQFSAAGGRVFFVDRLPDYVDGQKKQIKLAAEIGSAQQIAEKMQSLSAQDFWIKSDGKFLSKRKSSEDGDYLFLVCFDTEEACLAEISVAGNQLATEICLRTGETRLVEGSFDGEQTRFQKTFAKGQEWLLRLSPREERKYHRPKKISSEGVPVALTAEPMRYTLSEPNVLVLDYAHWEVDGKIRGYDEILKIDGALRREHGFPERSANNLQPWFEEKHHGEIWHKKQCRVTMRFSFLAETIPGSIYCMAEDLPGGRWLLNGHAMKKSRKKPFIHDVCFSRWDIPSQWLREGENELEVTFDFTKASNPEAVYLAGDFGVRAGHPSTITALPDTIPVGDIESFGFPFYTGEITYYLPLKNGCYDIQMGKFGGTCVAVGKKMEGFAPWRLENVQVRENVLPLTVSLLRRNLLGPLHEIPKNHGNYWSGSFRTDGDKFTDKYQLNPQGLLEIPKVFYKGDMA